LIIVITLLFVAGAVGVRRCCAAAGQRTRAVLTGTVNETITVHVVKGVRDATVVVVAFGLALGLLVEYLVTAVHSVRTATVATASARVTVTVGQLTVPFGVDGSSLPGVVVLVVSRQQ
jgi:hypothetical protein